MNSNTIRLRWINYAGYEIQLPNGKYIVLDPCTDYEGKVKNFSEEDYEGADYIILSHTHYDHTKDVGYLEKKFNSRVIVGQMSANALAEFYNINPDHLYPVSPQERYDFDDFTLQVFRGKHTFFNDPTLNIKNIRERSEGKGYPFPLEHVNCDIFGYTEYLDYLITTEDNYSMYISGGGPHKFTHNNINQIMYQTKPNLLFRQTSSKYTPEEFGKMALDFGAQYVFPLHQDGLLRKTSLTIEEYINRSNDEIERLGSQRKVFNPIQHKWYKIQTSIIVEDE